MQDPQRPPCVKSRAAQRTPQGQQDRLEEDGSDDRHGIEADRTERETGMNRLHSFATSAENCVTRESLALARAVTFGQIWSVARGIVFEPATAVIGTVS